MSHEQETEQQSAASRDIEIAAYPLAGVAAAYAVNAATGDKLYDNLKKTQKLTGLSDHKKTFVTTNFGEKTAEQMEKFHQGWGKAYEARVEELGFKTFKDRFVKGLHANQRLEVVTTGLAAAGIALGVLLTVASSKSLFNRTKPGESNERS